MKRLIRFIKTCILAAAFFVLPERVEAQSPAVGADSVKQTPVTAVVDTTAKKPMKVFNQKAFTAYVRELREEAIAQGISRRVVEDALPLTLTPVPQAVEQDRKQPEVTTTIDQYLEKVLSPTRISNGKAGIAENRTLLDSVSAAYGVEPEIVVALWGCETSYGRYPGTMNIPRALATLAFEGRRRAFFKDELLKALKIVDQGHIPLSSLKGSWAGAMGQVQFMPSSFFAYAQDFNGDGRKDIWQTRADVFASAANYLAKSGWKKGEPWGARVNLPADFDADMIGYDKICSVDVLRAKGVRLADGSPLPDSLPGRGAIVRPSGPGTSAFILFNNGQVLMKWNKSSRFVASIGLLAEKIKP